jgi:hypothetical protein
MALIARRRDPEDYLYGTSLHREWLAVQHELHVAHDPSPISMHLQKGGKLTNSQVIGGYPAFYLAFDHLCQLAGGLIDPIPDSENSATMRRLRAGRADKLQRLLKDVGFEKVLELARNEVEEERKYCRLSLAYDEHNALYWYKRLGEQIKRIIGEEKIDKDELKDILAQAEIVHRSIHSAPNAQMVEQHARVIEIAETLWDTITNRQDGKLVPVEEPSLPQSKRWVREVFRRRSSKSSPVSID